MTGHSLELTRPVEATVERVWEVLTDLDRASDTLSGVERIERLTEGPYDVGTRWRETRTILRKRSTEEMWVVENEPPSHTVVASESGGVRYRTTFDVAPDGAGSRLTMTFTAVHVTASRLQRLLWRVFGRLGLRATRKVMQRDLADIAAAAERSPGPSTQER